MGPKFNESVSEPVGASLPPPPAPPEVWSPPPDGPVVGPLTVRLSVRVGISVVELLVGPGMPQEPPDGQGEPVPGGIGVAVGMGAPVIVPVPVSVGGAGRMVNLFSCGKRDGPWSVFRLGTSNQMKGTHRCRAVR